VKIETPSVGYVIPFFTLCVGFFAGKMSGDIPGITINRQIDPVQSTALLLTGAASFVFFRKFERGKHSDQLEKSGLLKALDKCEEPLTRLEQLIEQRPTCSYAEIVAANKKLGVVFGRFRGFAHDVSCAPSSETQKRCWESIASLKRLLTDTPVVADGAKPELSVAGNELTISDDRRAEALAKLEEVRQQIVETEKQVIKTT
jgi:hypothetical protein